VQRQLHHQGDPHQPVREQQSPVGQLGALGRQARVPERCLSAPWMLRRSLGRSSDRQQLVGGVVVSGFLREKENRSIVDVEQAAGSFKVLQPEDTGLVADPSPNYRDSLLFSEEHLRHTVTTDSSLMVGYRPPWPWR
jgi:hypothetical protein